MSNPDVALGKAAAVKAGVSVIIEPKTVEERLAALEAKIDLLVKNAPIPNKPEQADVINTETNRDGLPFYLNLIGITKGVPYVLTVMADAYYVGDRPHTTLSAAAQAVSGVRRSGWTFWKLPDGRTAKEVFGGKARK